MRRRLDAAVGEMAPELLILFGEAPADPLETPGAPVAVSKVASAVTPVPAPTGN